MPGGPPIAALLIGGSADPIMPFGGGAVADFEGRGEGGQVLSAAATADLWARRNGCAGLGQVEDLHPVEPSDATRVVRTSYTRCPVSGPVALLAVRGGGHAWPGGAQFAPPALVGLVSGQLDASLTVVDFFLSLPRR